MQIKTVKAVKPYIYKNNSNFKLAVYNAWREIGGKTVAERPCCCFEPRRAAVDL